MSAANGHAALEVPEDLRGKISADEEAFLTNPLLPASWRARRIQWLRMSPAERSQREENEARREAQEQREMRSQMIADRLAAIPPVFRQAHVVDERVTQWVDKFLAGSHKSVLFAGPVGTGKTAALWTVFRAIVERRAAARIEVWKAITLLRKMRWDGNSPPSVSPQPLIDCELLMLDDLGAEKATPTTDERLYEVIDARYEMCRPIVATTNLNPGEKTKGLDDALGDRMASRLNWMGDVVLLTGEDRRRA